MSGLLSIFRKKKTSTSCSVVVVAAGSARRMQGMDKILTPLGELPVIVHTLYVFEDCPAVTEVVVVAREDMLVEIGRLCREFALNKVTKVVVGGVERIHSVWAGLEEVSPQAELIAIHDGARPLLPRQVLESVLDKAAQTGAAAPAVAVTDTIKRVENGLAVETVERAALQGVQTPQVFEAGLIRAATKKALDDGALLTDDCAAVERLGMKVSMTEGSRENIKITTPIDLLLGEAILQARVMGG